MAEFFDDSSLALTVVWQTTVWLAAGMLLATFHKGAPGRAHARLLICTVAAAATPLVSVVFTALGWGLFPAVAPGAAPGAGAAVDLTQRGAASVLDLGWETAFLALWVVLTTVAIARFVRSLAGARRWVRAESMLASSEIHALATEAARDLGLDDVPEVRMTRAVRSPVIWGWGPRPCIFLPESRDASTHRSVLLHELAHYKRRDHWSGLVAELVRCAFPWHPLAHSVVGRLALLSDRACDAWVVEHGEDPLEYAETLINLAPQRATVGVPAARSTATGLADRVRRLVEAAHGTPRPGRTAVALALALPLIAVVALTQRASAEPGPIAATTSAALPARLAVDPEGPAVRLLPAELELGTTTAGVDATGRLWLVNTSDEPLLVERVQASCGCTVVAGVAAGTELPPGAQLELTVTMQPSERVGERKTKSVTIVVEGQAPLRVPVHLTTVSGSSEGGAGR